MNDAIKKFRRRIGCTQEELAARLKVSVSTVQKWESGATSPGPRSMRDLKRLGFDLAEWDKEQKK